ncbi:MAG: septal ring lytic transglycosylase RlpA family protein [Gemmatimonadota bacterium]
MATRAAMAAALVAVLLAAGCVPSPVYRGDGPAPAASPPPSEEGAPPATRSSRPPPRPPPPVVTPPTTAHPVDPGSISTANAYQVGTASYYGKQFHGRRTANGEVFNMYKMTAAHRVLPLGTVIKVTNLANGRWAVVKVNDRGPFVEGRVLDLSFAAALELEMVEVGTANVMIEIVEPVQ